MFVECRTSRDEVQRRLHERAQQADAVSDATWEIALQQETDFPSFDDLPQAGHWVVETVGNLDEALAPVEEALYGKR
jgi:predicted kinase